MNDKVVILLIDDEINVLRSLKRVLMQEGYETECVTEPGKALRMIDCNRYDIIICDQKMPELSGIDILEYSSKVSPLTIRILLTAYSDIKVMQDAINKCNIHYYFPKPWDNDLLLDVVKRAINEKKDKEKKEEIINNIIGYKKHLQDILNIIDDTKSDIQPVKNQKEEGFKEKERTDIITLKKKDSIIFVKPSDIYYLASNQGKVTIVVRDDQYQSWDTLKVWEKRLKGYGFLRCHRSYLVNVEKIKTITPWFKDTYNLKLHDISHEIYCSKSYIKDLKDFISIRHQNSP